MSRARGWRLKTCKCGLPRTEVEHFYSCGGKRERRTRSICKACHSAASNVSRGLHLAYSIFKQDNDRARKRNLECTISRAWIDEALGIARCAATGVDEDVRQMGGRTA